MFLIGYSVTLNRVLIHVIFLTCYAVLNKFFSLLDSIISIGCYVYHTQYRVVMWTCIMNFVGSCVLIMLLSIATSVCANHFTSETLYPLDDHALARVSGQDGSIQSVRDPISVYGHKTIDALSQLREKSGAGNLNQLTSMFYVNPAGQLVLQINKEVVSIGVIEFRLHIDGLREMGAMFSEQILVDYN